MQPGYQIYRNLEDLLVKACRGQKFEILCVVFYAKDVKKLDLQTQLSLFRAMMIELHTSKLTLNDIVKCSRHRKCLYAMFGLYLSCY